VQQEIWSNSNTRVSAQCGGVPECVFFGLQVTYPITPTCFHERILARRTLQQPGSKHHSMICVVAHALADAERCSSVGAPLTCIVQPGPSQSFGVPVQRNKMRPTFSSCSLAAQPTADYFSSSSSCRYTTNRESERKWARLMVLQQRIGDGEEGGNEPRIESTPFFKSKAEEI
jgi:hypothetical protein